MKEICDAERSNSDHNHAQRESGGNGTMIHARRVAELS